MTARTAVIYCRISRDKSGAGHGVDRQEQDCRALADRLGWSVLNTYVDNDISASTGKRRPGYEQVLSDLENGSATAVIAWHADRLHRRPIELENFIDVCDRNGVEIRTVQAGEMDLSTASGKMIARMLGAAARHEVEHKSERIKRARVQMAQQGRYGGGRRGFGWEADGMTLRQAEAEALRQAGDQVLAGVSLRQVVADLNRRGVKPTTAQKWTSTSLVSMLRAPRNTGLAVYRGEIVGEAQWPVIIDRDKWSALQSILDNPARRTGGGTVPKWIGSGIYLCGVCGAALRVNRSSDGHRRYRCVSRTPKDPRRHVGRSQEPLDEFVVATLLARLARPDAADLFTARPTESVDIGALKIESTALAERLDGLAVLFAQGTLTEAQLSAGTEEIRRRQKDITDSLARAVSVNPLAPLADADDIEERWLSLSLGIQREILKSVVTVTILPTKPGRKKDGGYFDYDGVQFDWA